MLILTACGGGGGGGGGGPGVHAAFALQKHTSKATTPSRGTTSARLGVCTWMDAGMETPL